MRLLRAFLIFEFLIAIKAIFTFWSQVGGQYHLDLMFWPWKFGVSVAAALCVTGMTAGLARSGGAMTRKVWVLGALLIVTIAIAGCVTYYYHLNEPADEEETDDTAPTVTRNFVPQMDNMLPVRSTRCSGFRSCSGCRAISTASVRTTGSFSKSLEELLSQPKPRRKGRLK